MKHYRYKTPKKKSMEKLERCEFDYNFNKIKRSKHASIKNGHIRVTLEFFWHFRVRPHHLKKKKKLRLSILFHHFFSPNFSDISQSFSAMSKGPGLFLDIGKKTKGNQTLYLLLSPPYDLSTNFEISPLRFRNRKFIDLLFNYLFSFISLL